ncbi:PREDICTED: uncharacterized protein LOC105462281, partial [Wasmannia auropunctata]|uniref:uncharacterized protein LOC105462281 n=1 Tax=Wasmannia auropunctata TaxID=64793 RepID=UPI0005EE2FE7
KLWVEKRIFETPQSTSDAPDNVCNATFPRRSQRVKHLHSHRSIGSSFYMQMKKRQVKTSVLKNLKRPSTNLLGEYHSEENTPSYTRKQRFMMENCNNTTDSTHKSRENEDTSIKLLKAELEYQRSLNKFHLQSRCNNLDEMKEIERKCQTLQL